MNDRKALERWTEGDDGDVIVKENDGNKIDRTQDEWSSVERNNEIKNKTH